MTTPEAPAKMGYYQAQRTLTDSVTGIRVQNKFFVRCTEEKAAQFGEDLVLAKPTKADKDAGKIITIRND